MVRKAELSKEKRAQIWILEQEGLSQRAIADRVGVSQSTVSVTLCRCREMEGTYASRKRSGRPSVVTPRIRNQLRVMIKKSPKASSSKLQTQLPQSNIISQRTIRRVLFSEGFKAYRPAKKPMLTRKNIQDRLNFCKQYKGWNSERWSKVLFSDESTICQFGTFVSYVRRQDT